VLAGHTEVKFLARKNLDALPGAQARWLQQLQVGNEENLDRKSGTKAELAATRRIL
jgi:hypothetical protein